MIERVNDWSAWSTWRFAPDAPAPGARVLGGSPDVWPEVPARATALLCEIFGEHGAPPDLTDVRCFYANASFASVGGGLLGAWQAASFPPPSDNLADVRWSRTSPCTMMIHFNPRLLHAPLLVRVTALFAPEES